MRRTSGFTLIEVLITVTVMVVLLILGVVSMSNTEPRARDEERKTDAAIIARHLENYYSTGVDTSPAIGEYPSTAEINTEAKAIALLRGIDAKVLRAPTLNDNASINFVMATTNATNPPAPAPSASLTAGAATYVYQPLTSTGALCTSAATECRKFNLYYVLETDATATVQVIASKNQ
jgi:type II secretory pathway pseudopilin PulG